jgi:hypothetical protein
VNLVRRKRVAGGAIPLVGISLIPPLPKQNTKWEN